MKLGPLVILRETTQKQREDDAWAEGYHCDDDAIDDALAAKDAFIEGQAEAIDRLGQVLQVISRTKGFDAWEFVPEDLRQQLAGYL
jgi:hypothetical protein